MRFARIDSRESFAIETPILIAHQADSHESLEFLIRANHATKTQNLVVKFDGEICGGVLVEKASDDFPQQKKLENLLPNFAGSSPPISPKTSPTSLWKSLVLIYFTHPPENFCGFIFEFTWEFCIEELRGFLVNFFWSPFPTKRSSNIWGGGGIRGKIWSKIRDEHLKNSGSFRSATFLT